MNEKPKIVVLTPVKNEAWILSRFLATTSQWADLIIIADQNSSDESFEICKQFPKVVLIRNENPNYDEAQRQLLLIKTARELVPGLRILFALDADEILAANALECDGWEKIKKAIPGTAIFVEKPDLYLSAEHCLRWPRNPVPIAYVDDGVGHRPKLIHSVRIPLTENTPRLILDDVKVLHYAWANRLLQENKIRYYSVIENIKSVSPHIKRRYAYRRKFLEKLKSKCEKSELAWFHGWEVMKIDMKTVPEMKSTWHDIEILRHFANHGPKHFFWDDIWDKDWEGCRKQALEMGCSGMPTHPICPPSLTDQKFRDLCANAYGFLRRLRHKLCRT